ncbi:phage late control D family protein [Cyanobacteria bacterium FACHB-472]|nr:phage late control D family protein [Cyanobacteria bacterium FACHB-472]
MVCEHFTITIDDEEVSDLYQNLVSFEVELDDELAAMFRLHIAIALQPDGSWTHLDDEQFRVWQPITITAGLESGTQELISGYITHVKPSFAPDITQCTLEVWGMDGSVLMDREEKLKDWPNKKDSDIAAEIFSQYGFTPETEDTVVIHDEAISTTIQRETDIQFLRRLALRNGFECYVEGKTGYFRSPKLDAPPQPVLAVHFGDETNVQQFSLEVNALTPANVAMFQVDRATKEILDVTTETSQQPALGETDASGLLTAGMNPGVVVVGGVVATGQPEMNALCQGLYDQGSWFVTGVGEVAANDYGHVLRARQTVTIKGIGETYSGIYYVTHVTHSFTTEGYTQSFRMKRNGLLPTGAEEFSASSGLLGGLL